MYIGCNWSKALKALLEREEVDVDYIKYGDYKDFNKIFTVMRSMRPVLLHGLGYFERAGMKKIEIIDFDRANDIIKKCDSPHYGVHLAIETSDINSDMTDYDIYNRMSSNIKIFKNNIKVPLLVENIPDSYEERVKFNHYPYIMPEEINQMILENDVSLLLDLTHAKITAKYRGWDVKEYISKLPLSRVREIHVSGSGYDDEGFPKDTHQSMKDEDYELLDWILNYTNPDIVTLEYNGIQDENDDTISNSLKTQLGKIENICGLIR